MTLTPSEMVVYSPLTPTGTVPTMIEIAEYRIVPAPLTGIGWYAVQRWDGYEYRHVSTFRSREMAQSFIDGELAA